MANTLLGGLAPAQFMRRHWQKSARLIRQAIPGFAGVCRQRELFALAARDDVESRLVVRTGSAKKPDFFLEHGPFRHADFKAGSPTRAGHCCWIRNSTRRVSKPSCLATLERIVPKETSGPEPTIGHLRLGA